MPSLCVSVQGAPAILCAAQARNLVFLDGELVVVGDLLVDADGLLGIDYNLLLGLYGDDFGIAIRLRKGKMHKGELTIVANS